MPAGHSARMVSRPHGSDDAAQGCPAVLVHLRVQLHPSNLTTLTLSKDDDTNSVNLGELSLVHHGTFLLTNPARARGGVQSGVG